MTVEEFQCGKAGKAPLFPQKASTDQHLYPSKEVTMRKIVVFCFYLAIFAQAISTVKADVIYLKDGAAIVGTATAGPEEDKVTFKTTYGDLIIPKSLILKVEYGTFDVRGEGWRMVQRKESTPFPLRFVASPAVGFGFAGGGNLETGQTGLLFGGEIGVDPLRWLSLRAGFGTAKFGRYSAGSGGQFGSFSSEAEVQVTSLLIDALWNVRIGKAVFDMGVGPGLYFTKSRVPYSSYDPNNQTYTVYEYSYNSTDFGGHGTVAYRFFIMDKLSIDLKDRFHVLGGGISWLEGATGGVSFYF